MLTKQLTSKTVAAIVIGNALEWYDFVVYSFMTVYIAKLFFPSVSDIHSLLAATATFGVAFFMRPIGGLVFGIYADRCGRKIAMTTVIAVMTVGMLMIALAPTYAQIGIAAPILIVCSRLLQGFSAGGEFGISSAILIELAPPHQKGFYGSWQMVGQMVAMLLGALMGGLLAESLSQEQIESWGWRFPFIVGLLIAPVGVYIRGHLSETHIVRSNGNQAVFSASNFFNKVKLHAKQIMMVMGLVVGGTVSNYINISYMPTYATKYLNLPIGASFTGLIYGVSMMIVLIPAFGWLSDRIGRKSILVGSLCIYLLVLYPLFYWLNQAPTVMKLIIVQMTFCLLLSGYYGVFIAIITELFPKEIRATGLAISYNLAVMLFGGFAQFIVTWLINETETPLAIVYYLVMAIGITLISAMCYQEKGRNHE